MNSRAWNILCWNVRGLNDREKWDPIRNKLDESDANMFCLQETKKAVISNLSESLPQKNLINLTSVHLRVLLGES